MRKNIDVLKQKARNNQIQTDSFTWNSCCLSYTQVDGEEEKEEERRRVKENGGKSVYVRTHMIRDLLSGEGSSLQCKVVFSLSPRHGFPSPLAVCIS